VMTSSWIRAVIAMSPTGGEAIHAFTTDMDSFASLATTVLDRSKQSGIS
jgi:hypothetical protein